MTKKKKITFAVVVILFVASMIIPCFAESPFQSSVETSQIEAITAKAASIEPMTESVAVFLVEPDQTKKLGLSCRVTSTAKFSTIRATAENSTKQIPISRRQNGEYFFFATPGRYSITLVEFDPEKGIYFSESEAVIAGPKPDKPDVPPPPVDGDFANLKKIVRDTIVRDSAGKVKDPTTARLLGEAYKIAVSKMADGKTYDECRAIAIAARFAILNSRAGESRLVDWNTMLVAVDGEVQRLAGMDSTKYRLAISALAESLATAQ